jgi:hypothetical protein
MLLVLCCAVADAAVSWAQDSLPAGAKTAADVAQFEAQIQSFVQAQAQKLASAADPSAQSAGRDALVKAVDDQPSPAFLDTYAHLLNDELLKLAENENMRVRLNAAIVAARVAEKANNARLSEAARKFLQDEATPVVMWGMTTAKWVVPAIMADPLQRQNNPLPAELVPALKNHPAGPIVSDTYDALGLGIFQNITAVPPGLDAVIPLMLDLIAYRVDLYTQDIPDEPWADQKAGLFFQNRGVWQSLKPPQQVAAIQALLNLTSVAAQQTKNGTDADKEQLVDLVRQLAGSMEIIAGTYLQHQGLRQAAQLAGNIDKNTPPIEIKGRVERLYPQIIQISALKGVQGPPIISNAPPQAATTNEDAEAPAAEEASDAQEAQPEAAEEPAAGDDAQQQ